MIAKAIKRRFGLHARKVKVQTQWSGYLRWSALACIGAAIGFFVWLAYAAWDRWDVSFGATAALKRLEEERSTLEKENAQLRSESAVLGRQLQIERASQAELAKQVKAMAAENARLKEDAALVQAVSAADSKVDGIKVTSARVEAGAVAGEYNYRIVLLQTGARKKSFEGRYQLVVNFNRGEKKGGLSLPEASDSGAQVYKLSFRVSQRIEGTFKVEPDAVVRSVEIRVFQGRQKQPKVMQRVKLTQ